MSRSAESNNRRGWPAIILGLLLLVCLFLMGTGLLLKKGIRGEIFHIGPLSVSGVHLQWQDKLMLEIDSMTVALEQTGTHALGDLDFVDKGIKLVRGLDFLFQEISVKSLHVGEVRGRAQFAAGEFFTELSARDFALRSRLKIEDNILLIDIEEAGSKRFHSNGTGNIRLNLKEMRATGSLDVILADSLPLTLKLTADREQIAFHGRESDTITNITPFVDLFGLSPDIQCWITDYLKGSRYELKTFHGSFPWDDPLQFLDTLYAEVRVEDCEYTFAPGLEPIKTDYTDVVFQKGVLAITPHDSRFYGQDGEDSWLDINFNDPDNILLTAYILTHAVANEDILNLLEYYGISLPFVQTAGKTGADLTLAVNLNEGQLTAYGSFVIDEGEMEYEQKKYDVREARISLENATVSLERMRIAFKDMFTAGISGTVDLSDKRGDLDIAVHEFKIEVGGSSLSFDPSGTQPVLQYQIRPDGEYIGAAPSSWTLDNLHLRLGSFSMPFSFSDLSGVLPLTQLSLPGKVEAEVSGDFSIKGQQVDFQCDLLQHNVKDLVLEQERLPLSLQYDEKLTIRSQKLSQWSLNHIPVTVYPSTLSYGDNLLSILDSRIKYGHFFDSHVSGHYSYQDNQGGFLLENLQISEEGLGNLLNPGKAVSLEVDGSRESLLVRVPELDMEISTGEEKSWTVAFNDLGLLHKHSKLLRRYVLDSGTLTVSSADGEKPYSFFADIPYRYPLLVKNNKVVDHFIIDGEISEQRVQATVNEDLQIVYDERLAVTSKDIGYNIPAILKFMEEQRNLKEDDSEEKERADYSILAMQSSLYFSPDSQAPADLIRLHSADGIIRLELEHGEGSIVADIDDERFSLLGGDLNDVFMNALSPDARLQGGTMSVVAHGSFDEFSVLAKVDDTVLRDYKTLNNVLAFVNTIPALITFTLPQYDTVGLPVTSAVAGMTVKGGVANFESLDVDSPELGIVGAGWIDFPQKRIEMDLNLITQSKVNVTKIPLIGYILAGEEKQPSITVKLSGDMDNPEVQTEVFREVVTMPFSILYRTLSLPGQLVSPMLDESAGGEPGEEYGENDGETAVEQ